MVQNKFHYILLLLLSVNIVSCKKGAGVDGDIGSGSDIGSGNSADSIIVLSGFKNEAYGGGRSLLYDTSSNLIVSYVYYNPTYYDSLYFRYNNNKSLKSVIGKQGGQEYKPIVFEYDIQNRITKIYHKFSIYEWDPSYFDSYDIPLDIDSYDSLNYDNKNRIISSYTFSCHNNFPTDTYITNTLFLKYSAINDSLLSQAQSFNYDNMGIQVSTDMLKFNSYDTLVNPLYRDLRYNHFFGNKAFFSFLPMQASSYLTSLLTFSPHNCTSVSIINSWGIANYHGGVPYFYNSDKLPIYITTNHMDYFRYYYQKIKK